MDYKETVFLPKTEFPMKAGLPRKEPEILKIWEEINIYQKLREQRKGSEKYILHDGPPYANGNLHIGTALNKILKDIINRFQSMIKTLFQLLNSEKNAEILQKNGWTYNPKNFKD